MTSDKEWTKILVTYNKDEITMYSKYDEDSVQKETSIVVHNNDLFVHSPKSTEVTLSTQLSWLSANAEYKKLFVWDKTLEDDAINLLLAQSGEYKNNKWLKNN